MSGICFGCSTRMPEYNTQMYCNVCRQRQAIEEQTERMEQIARRAEEREYENEIRQENARIEEENRRFWASPEGKRRLAEEEEERRKEEERLEARRQWKQNTPEGRAWVMQDNARQELELRQRLVDNADMKKDHNRVNIITGFALVVLPAVISGVAFYTGYPWWGILITGITLVFLNVVVEGWDVNSSDNSEWRHKWEIQRKKKQNDLAYIGESRNKVKHGHGTYTWLNGDQYVGEWIDDERNGRGTFTSKDGTKTIGLYKDDKYVGPE